MNYRDITERLRDHVGQCAPVDDQFGYRCVRCEAADHIDALRRKIFALDAPIWEKYAQETAYGN